MTILDYIAAIVKSSDTFQFMGAQGHYFGSPGNRYSERSWSNQRLHQRYRTGD